MTGNVLRPSGCLLDLLYAVFAAPDQDFDRLDSARHIQQAFGLWSFDLHFNTETMGVARCTTSGGHRCGREREDGSTLSM